MGKYETRVVKLVVLSRGELLNSENSISVELTSNEDNEEFVFVEQNDNAITIKVDSWDELKSSIDQLIAECRKYGKK
jgi:hypothetical protein